MNKYIPGSARIIEFIYEELRYRNEALYNKEALRTRLVSSMSVLCTGPEVRGSSPVFLVDCTDEFNRNLWNEINLLNMSGSSVSNNQSIVFTKYREIVT